MSIIHNNTSSSEKVNLLHQNPATYLFRAVLSCKQCLICADFSPDSYQTTFSLEEALLLSMDYVNWWTGVVWIIVMFLSAVWTLILTAPIHCRGSIAETVMQCCISTNLTKKQTRLGWPEGEGIFSLFKCFWWTIPLIMNCYMEKSCVKI